MDGMLIGQWIDAKNRLKVAKEEEARLRIEICNTLFALEPRKDKVTFDDGFYGLVAIKVYSVKLDEGQLSAVGHLLTDVDAECLDKKTVISKSRFMKLPGDSVLRKCVVVSLGMPKLVDNS